MYIMYQRVMPNGRRASFVPESWLADNIFQPGEFENLVFGGGGYKGIAYVGALKVKFSVMLFLHLDTRITFVNISEETYE